MIATHVGEVGVAYVARADKQSGFLVLKKKMKIQVQVEFVNRDSEYSINHITANPSWMQMGPPAL